MPTNLDVAKAWVAGRTARSSNGNLSCSGYVLTSYSTPIAKIVDGVALITCHSYSATTQGKHKNAAKRACGYSYFEVPYVLADGGRAPRMLSGRNGQPVTPLDYHKANATYLRSLCDKEKQRLERARVHTSLQRFYALEIEAERYELTFVDSQQFEKAS